MNNELYEACGSGNIEKCIELLKYDKIDINKTNNYGCTALYTACSNNSLEIVKLLLNDKRLDVNKGDDDGWTAFYTACLHDNLEIVKLLLNEPRIDVNKTNYKGLTPLDTACEDNYIKIIEILLRNPRINIDKINESVELSNEVKIMYESYKNIKRDKMSDRKLAVFMAFADGNIYVKNKESKYISQSKKTIKVKEY